MGSQPRPQGCPRSGARLGLATGALLATTVLGSGLSEASAQVKPSERATVSQTVDGTVIEIDYARPRARGRDNLFGGVVHWDEVWTPGANDATVITLNRGVSMEGHDVPEGRRSVWMVVKEEGPWEVVLDPRDDRWHTVHPEPTDEQIRFPVATETTDEPVGTLLWYFPEVRRSGTTLVMAWGDVRVPLDIEVEPTYRYTMSADEAEPFLGDWDMERTRGRNEGRVREVRIVHHEDGSLRLVSRSGDDSPRWVLQPRAEGIFQLGWTRDGELWSGSSMYLEMRWEDGEPTGFAVRDSDDDIVFSGRKVR